MVQPLQVSPPLTCVSPRTFCTRLSRTAVYASPLVSTTSVPSRIIRARLSLYSSYSIIYILTHAQKEKKGGKKGGKKGEVGGTGFTGNPLLSYHRDVRGLRYHFYYKHLRRIRCDGRVESLLLGQLARLDDWSEAQGAAAPPPAPVLKAMRAAAQQAWHPYLRVDSLICFF